MAVPEAVELLCILIVAVDELFGFEIRPAEKERFTWAPVGLTVTLILLFVSPLDMKSKAGLWLKDIGVIVTVAAGLVDELPPCETNPCPLYPCDVTVIVAFSAGELAATPTLR